MNYLIKEKLKDRLEYCLNWRRDTELYLVSVDLTDTVNSRYYERKPLIRFFLKILNLPIDTYQFFKFLRIRRDLEKNAIEIDYIHSQLKNKEDYYEKK